MNIEKVADDILAAIVHVDSSGTPFKEFRPGVGPYGEPQLIKMIAEYLNTVEKYSPPVKTKRTPDLLIPDQWAIEFKIARPFGDNGKEAEDWSVNLLHPYPGNVSSIGDCYKLLHLECREKKAVAVIGYEHIPAKIYLAPLMDAFETIAKHVAHISLSPRISREYHKLCHPVHQAVHLHIWEVLGPVEP